jgi:hypothetical protein
MAVVLHDNQSGSFELRWPPEDWEPATVHPDAEAAERSVRAGYEAFGVQGAVDVKTGAWNPHLLVYWQPPFDALFRAASGLDPFHAHAQMRAVVQQATSDPAGALAAARARASPYLAEGDASLAVAALGPRAVELHRADEPMTVRPFWESYGIIAESAPKAFASPEAQCRVPVTRTWGGIGLLWALLIARLEEARTMPVCERCGKTLAGNKKFCDQTDDPACYAARRAQDQRLSRKLRGKKPRRLPSGRRR